jgi:hypothetical protein
MQNIHSENTLRDAILELERRHTDEGKVLKQHFYTAYESIQPINIIKNTFKEVASNDDLKDNILNTGVGLAIGFASEKLFEKVSKNPLKKLIGTAILFGITNVVAKNPETVKALGRGLLNFIFNKSKVSD